MPWYGTVRCGLHGLVWYGMVWYGMVWYGMVWYGMVWYGMVWYGMVWYGMVWYGMVWYGVVPYGMVWCSITSIVFSVLVRDAMIHCGVCGVLLSYTLCVYVDLYNDHCPPHSRC